jgi:hypothetical protein
LLLINLQSSWTPRPERLQDLQVRRHQRRRTTAGEEDPVVVSPEQVTSAADSNTGNPQTAAAPVNKVKPMIKNIQIMLESNVKEYVKTAVKELKSDTFKANCYDEPDWKETFTKCLTAGICPALLKTLRNYTKDQAIVSNCIGCLVQLGACNTSDAKMLEILLDLDAVEIILGVMAHHEGFCFIQDMGIRFMGNICFCLKEPVIARISQIHSSIETILDAMGKHKDNLSLQNAACKTIYNLFLFDKYNQYEMKKKLKAAKAMTKVAQAMELHGEDADLQICGKFAMEKLLA